MKASVDHRCRASWTQRVIAIEAMLAVLLVGILAASPELHRWIHPDAGRADHECVVTLFLHGVEAAPVALISVAVWPILLGRMAAVPEALLLAAPRHLLAPGRAPPLA